jgi:hypothetical protein
LLLDTWAARCYDACMLRFLPLTFSTVAAISQLVMIAATSYSAISWDVNINDPGAAFSAYYQPIESN